MRISSTGAILGAMGVAAAAMVAIPLVVASPPSSSQASAAPSPTPTPTLVSTHTPTPVPTSTIKPNSRTVQQTLAAAVDAYSAAKDAKGGVAATVFAANGYATKARQAPNGDVVSETGSPTVPQVLRHGGAVYAQLAGAELENSVRLREAAGKPGATWTTDVGRIAPIINQWLYPVDLAGSYRALAPGLTFDDMYAQDDGTTVVVASLDPAKVTDPAAREAFKLPSQSEGAAPVAYPTHFGIAPGGELTRMVVNAPNSTQVVVSAFEPVTITPPAPDVVISAEDINAALQQAAE